MKAKYVVLMLLVVLCPLARPQQSILHHHEQLPLPSDVIHGKDHPEQIPDHAAYDLFLTAVSRPSVPTDAEKHSQAVQLKMMNLSDSDTQAAITILASFNERRKALIEDYNAKAEAANTQGQAVDPAVRQAFFTNLASLIDTTHDNLKSILSAVGWSQWNARVQHEKRGMTIPTPEGQQ